MKFKPIMLLIILIAVIVFVNATMAAEDDRQVTISNIMMSANTDPGHPGTFLSDGDQESYWAVRPGSGDGWVELSLNQAALIYGLQLNGNLGSDARLSVEYQQNGYWMSFLGGSIKAIPAQGIVDLSYDRIVSDKLRLRLSGSGISNSRLAELKVLGQAATSVYHLIEPVEIKYSKDSFRTSPAKFLTDRNTFTAWRICHDDGDDDSDELEGNPIFEADAFHHHKIRQTRIEASRQVELELGGVYRLNSINLYITPDAQGSIVVKIKTGHQWQTVDQISLMDQSGWQRIDLGQKQIDADRVLIELQDQHQNQDSHKQQDRKGQKSNQSHQSNGRSGGIGEVEIWGYGAYSGAQHQTLVSVPEPATQALNYHFNIEEEGLTDNRLELAVAGEYSDPVTLELNGVPVKLQPTLKINGNTVYQYSIPESYFLEGENFIRVLPGDPSFTLLQLQVTESYIDGEASHLAGGLNDGLRLTPANESGTDFNLVRESFIEAVEIYAPSNLAATVSAKTGTGLVQLTQAENGEGYSYYQGGVSATGLNVINHTGLPFAEIRVLAGAPTNTAPEVKIIWPRSMDRPGAEIPECDDDDKQYVLGRIDNPEAQVSVNGAKAKQSGHYFWIRFSELSLNYGEVNSITVKAVDPTGRESSQQIEFFWGETPKYRIDQQDIIYYTNKTTFTISGRVGSRQYEVLVDSKPVTVDPKQRFSATVTLEEGFNLIPITFNYTDKGKAMKYTIYRRVVCESTAPKLYIDAPISGTYFSTNTVTVTGTVSGKNTTVRVNGLRATVENGWFRSLPVQLIEGNNTIKVEATDSYGRKTAVEVTLYKDTKAPVILNVTPADGSLFGTAQVTVSGQVSDTSQFYVYVNGKFAPYLNGKFTITLTLVEGENQIKVTAVDQAGNSQDYLFKVTVDTIAPLEFTPTADPSGWTNNNRPTISFVTTDATSWVDHYEIRVGDGAWTTPVVSPYQFATAVPDGEQTVQVKAVDKAGNERIGEVKVYIDTIPPAAPDGFEVIPGIDRAELRWKDLQGEVKGYRIKRSPAFSNGSYQILGRSVATESLNRYRDKEVTSGEEYTYSIQAIDRAGNESDWTQTITVRIGISIGAVNSDGGTYKFHDCEVTVPQGAIAVSGQVAILELDDEFPANPYADEVGPVYSLNLVDQDGEEIEASFNKPVTLTINYSNLSLPQGYNSGQLGIYWFNELTDSWEKLPRVRNDLKNKTLSVNLDHFSEYQVMASNYLSPDLESYYDLGVSPYLSYFKDNIENVSTSSGSLSVSSTDLKLPGRNGFDLVIKRIYDSTAAQQETLIESNGEEGNYPVDKTRKASFDSFGFGWSLNIPCIESNDTGRFLRLAEGQTISLSEYGDNFEYHEGVHFKLTTDYTRVRYTKHVLGIHVRRTRYDLNKYVLVLKDGTTYEIDKEGRTYKQVDPSGKNEILYEYDGRKLTKIIDSIGREIKFGYKTIGKYTLIEKIIVNENTDNQRTLKYEHDDAGKLISFTDPKERVTLYQYDYKHLRTGSTDQWREFDLYLLKTITYPTGESSTYNHVNHPIHISEEDSDYGSRSYTGFKILVESHEVAGKVTTYEYKMNDQYGSLWGYNFTPPYQYIESVKITEGDKTVQENFRIIAKDLQSLVDINTMLKKEYQSSGALAVSREVKIENDTKIVQRVNYEYNVPLRSITTEDHYRGGVWAYRNTSSYDGWGNLTVRNDGSCNLKETYTYHSHDRLKNMVATKIVENKNPLTNSTSQLTTSYTYDDTIGKPTEVKIDGGPEPLTTYYSYYDNGNFKSKTDPNGLVTEYEYDSEKSAFPVKKTVKGVPNEEGVIADIITESGYNLETGMKEWEKDPRGFTTSYQYDELNRIIQVTLPNDNQVSGNNPFREYRFDDDNNLCDFFNEKGQKTRFQFDGLGRLTEITKYTDGKRYATEVTTGYEYDFLGRIVKVTDPENRSTEYGYDGLNRVIRVTYPDASYVELQYNDLTNTVTIVDEMRKVTATERSDWANRLVEANQYCEYTDTSETFTWTFAYDSLGHKLRQIDPLLYQADQEYDALGRLIKTNFPTAALVKPGETTPKAVRPELSYEYDLMGNRTGEISANGNAAGSDNYKVSYEYDKLGRRTRVIAKATEMVDGTSVSNTYITQYFYDEVGNKVRTVLPNGKVCEYTYSARGWLLSETAPFDPANPSSKQITHYRYDVLGNKIAVIDPRNKSVETENNWYTTQTANEITTYQDRDPRSDKTFTTWYVYDDLNRLYRIVLPDNTPPTSPYLDPGDNPCTEITYDLVGNKKVERDANDVTTSYEYTSRNWLWKVKDGRGWVQKTYTYDKTGRVIGVTDFNNKTVISAYDSLGRLRKVIDPLSNSEEYQYDKLGNRTAVTDARGNTTYYAYNALGWLTGVRQPLGNFTQYRYDLNGNRVEAIAPNNLLTEAKYDELNRVVKSTDSLGNFTQYSYDEVGNRSGMKDRRGTEWVYQYYANNLLKRVDATGDDGTSYWAEYTYDDAGNRMSVTDSGNEIKYNFKDGDYLLDPLNRINSIDRSFDGANYRTEYEYDLAGLVTGILYPEALSMLKYNYNKDLNQLTEVTGFTTPDGISYNDDGSLKGINYANGAAAVYSYDANRRLDDMKVTVSGTELLNLDYTYDQVGNIKTVTDNGQLKSYEYDKNNQLTKAVTPGTFMETTPTPGTAALKTGDTLGNGIFEFTPILSGLMGLDYYASSIGIDFGSIAPAVKVIELVPDKNYTTHRIDENTIALYVSSDNMNYTLIPRTSWEYQKDSKGIVSLTLKEKLATRYLKMHVKYDERGRDFKPVNKATFLNEVAKMLRIYQEATARTEEYQYDAAGNRKLLKVSLVQTAEFTSQYYAKTDRLKTDGKYAFDYDKAGNMVKKGNTFTISGDTVSFTTKGEDVEYWEYKYDLLNRLIEVTKNNNDDMIVIAKYAYDPEGFRVVKYHFVDGTQSDKTHYVFQGTEPIFEKKISTGKIKSFVYTLGKHLARVDGVIGDDQAKKYWYVTDHLGSIRAVSDAAGKVVWKADYLAFGTQFGKNADTDFEELHSFTGKEYDPDTGLHYYNARWYDAGLGRFISEDPVADPNNPNLYSYCGNNPVNRIDPTGLDSLSDTYAEQDAADAENTSYFTSEQISSWGTPGSADNSTSGPSTSPNPGDSGGGTTGQQTKPGPSKPEGPNGTSNQGNVKTSRNGHTQTLYDTNGKIQSKTTFDRNGNIKSHTVYNQDGTRTETKYTYSENGILVEQKEQTRNIFGGWNSKEIEITGYNSKKDLDNNNWNFRINDDGRVTDNNWLVNGDLLAKGCATYLSGIESFKDRYVSWYNLVKTGGLWDFKDRNRLPDNFFTFGGRTYRADRFGNINYGYTGGSLGLPYNVLISGSVYAQDPRNGKSKWETDMEDWPDIAKGFIGQTGRVNEVNHFDAMFACYGATMIDMVYIPLVGELIKLF